MFQFEQGDVGQLREDNHRLDASIAEMKKELRTFIGLARWGLALIAAFLVLGFSASIWLTTHLAWRSSESISLNPPDLISHPPRPIRVETVSLPKPDDQGVPPSADSPPGLVENVTTPTSPR